MDVVLDLEEEKTQSLQEVSAVTEADQEETEEFEQEFTQAESKAQYWFTAQKMEQVEKHTKRQSLFLRISSLLLPGFGNLYSNQTILGTLILTLWLFLLAVLLFNSRFTELSYFEPKDSIKILTLICVTGLALLYAFANLPLLARRRT